ncbi:hypothetical protein C8J57DRAFT_1477334 [Mycena rebaudengoi]|nr:hypothetical protein C8J57DRAFT_1477334 [Mycena rebaudengoi]
MLSAKWICLALGLGVLGAPLEQRAGVNPLNGGNPRPVWVKREASTHIYNNEERSVNSLNGGNPRPVWVKREEERSVNSLNGRNPRPVWVKRETVDANNDGWA